MPTNLLPTELFDNHDLTNEVNIKSFKFSNLKFTLSISNLLSFANI